MAESEYRNAESPFYLDFTVKNDDRGKLLALEFHELPFQVNRYFSISVNDSSYSRGSHAHKKCWQAFFACQGSLKIVVKNTSGIQHFVLEPPRILVVPPYNWCEIRFDSKNSYMGVLASHPYQHEDYLLTQPPLEQKHS